MKNIFILHFYILFLTANTTTAQTSSQSGTVLPVSSVTTNTTTATSPAKSTTIPIKTKVYEYTPYCVDDIYNDAVLMTPELKSKRLDLIKNKLIKAKDSENNLEIKSTLKIYLDELYKQKKFKDLVAAYNEYQMSLDDEYKVYGSTLIEMSKNNFNAANKILNAYIEKNPKSIILLEKFYDVLMQQKNYIEAHLTLDDLSKINSKKDYLEELCKTATAQSEHADVRRYCLKLKTKYPKNEKASIYLGISERDQENHKKAIDYFIEATKINATEFAYTCLGETYTLNKQTDLAINAFNESLKLAPESKRAQLGLALSYIEKKQYDKALPHFEKACELGEKPLKEFTTILKTLKDTKNVLHENYFLLVQNCQRTKPQN